MHRIELLAYSCSLSWPAWSIYRQRKLTRGMEPSGQPEKALLMNLTKVSIHNIVGITEMEFSVKGKLTEISGENATGKTSILSAIQAAAGTGNFAHLIRQGAEKGDVVLEFDTGHVLTAKFGKTKTDRTVTIDGAKMMKVQEWLKARLNPMSFNPVSFMIADAPRRNEMILAITPLSLAFDDLLNAVGNRWVEGIDRGAGFGFEDPLSLLDSIKTKIFDNRTGLNRSIRDKDGQIAELKKTLPPETDEPIDPDGIEVKLKAMRETYKGRLENLEANFQNMKLSQEVTTRRLELLEAERHEKELKSIAAESRRQLELAQCEKDQSLRVLDEEFRAPLEALRERQGAVKARKGELDRSEATKNLIVRVEEERARHNDEAIDNSTALDKLQALRQKLL